MLPLTSLTLFMSFLKAGGLTIGDGYATIAPLRRELVEKNAWMDEADFERHLTTVHTMPGIFNVNFAVYLGRQLQGWLGSIVALLGMILPPMVVMITFATFFDQFRHFPAVESFLRGARPAIVAVIAIPAFQMWRKSSINLSTIWIPIIAAIAVGFIGVSPTYLILGFIAAGILYGFLVHSGD